MAQTFLNDMSILKMKSFPKLSVFELQCVIWQGYLGESLSFDQPCADLKANALLVLDRIITKTTSVYCHKPYAISFWCDSRKILWLPCE